MIRSEPDNHTDPGVAEQLAQGLRRAAREVASEGKPEVGAAYLRPALALLPDESANEVLRELAEIETTYDMRSAAEHFTALLSEAENVEIVADAASALLALYPSLRDDRVWLLARDAIDACEDDDLRLRLLARIGVAAVLTLDAGRWRDQVLAQLRDHGAVSAGEKAALGVTAFFDLWRGQPLEQVQRVTQALFVDDWVASLRGSGASFWLGMTALVESDAPLAPEAIDEALAYARQSSSTGAQGGTLALRAHQRLRAGDLAGAASDGRAAFKTFKSYGGGPVPLAHALAAVAQAEFLRGDIDAARLALAQAPSDVEAGTLGLAGIRIARVQLHAAAAPPVALAELLRIGEQYEALGGRSPALLPWRSQAALLAHQLGRNSDALELVDAELAAAERAGPRALGRALAVRAAVGPEHEALTTSAAAISELERVNAPLELAKALVVQARASAAAGALEDARGTFARALAIAERACAGPLARVARDGIVGVGGRPRRAAAVGVDGLTSAERAVARRATAGLSNREIAAALHLAPGTVKNQLASVYRKLGVNSRSQLAQALGELSTNLPFDPD